MLFNSYEFLFLYLPITLLGFFQIAKNSHRLAILWLAPASANVRALQSVEQEVRSLADKMGIDVIGSYHPDRVACRAEDFFDFMHAKPSCLARIDRLQAR